MIGIKFLFEHGPFFVAGVHLQDFNNFFAAWKGGNRDVIEGTCLQTKQRWTVDLSKVVAVHGVDEEGLTAAMKENEMKMAQVDAMYRNYKQSLGVPQATEQQPARGFAWPNQ